MHQFVGRLLVFTCGGEQWCNNYYSSSVLRLLSRHLCALTIIIYTCSVFPAFVHYHYLHYCCREMWVWCSIKRTNDVPLEQRVVGWTPSNQPALLYCCIPALDFWGNDMNCSFVGTAFSRILRSRMVVYKNSYFLLQCLKKAFKWEWKYSQKIANST